MTRQTESYNKICGRLCVEMTGHLVSPLSVGSGEQEYSDADVLLNAKGFPFIPGSSLAGAIRDYSTAWRGEVQVNQLFGNPKNGEPGSSDDRQSRIFFYDTVIGQAVTRIREGVKLDENKTCVFMGKYSYQIVERGAAFCMRMELIQREDVSKKWGSLQAAWEDDLKWVRTWMDGFNEGELRLGARSNRGFGRLRVEQVRIRKFDMTNPKVYREWLDWDWDKKDAFHVPEEEVWKPGSNHKVMERMEHCMEIPLQLPNTVLVREYKTAFAKSEGQSDYRQMMTGEKEEKAVIPGSSWAGAFRSQTGKIVQELAAQSGWEANPDNDESLLTAWDRIQKMLDPIYGSWIGSGEKKDDLQASKLIFEETVINGGHGLPIARNAIDRFTGGMAERALYQESPWAGGKVLLRIRWKKGGEAEPVKDDVICGMLLWVIRDLQEGILAVGGETSVGRGIFQSEEGQVKIKKDGEPLKESDMIKYMQASAKWIRDKI